MYTARVLFDHIRKSSRLSSFGHSSSSKCAAIVDYPEFEAAVMKAIRGCAYDALNANNELLLLRKLRKPVAGAQIPANATAGEEQEIVADQIAKMVRERSRGGSIVLASSVFGDLS